MGYRTRRLLRPIFVRFCSQQDRQCRPKNENDSIACEDPGLFSRELDLFANLRIPIRYRAFVSDRSGELPVPPDAGGIGMRATLM